MKECWCWRCEQVVPMLEEHEVERFETLRRAVPTHLVPHRLGKSFSRELDRQVFERVIGGPYPTLCAVGNHFLTNLGPLCPRCGKPLRTPRASYCAGCGLRREDVPSERGEEGT